MFKLFRAAACLGAALTLKSVLAIANPAAPARPAQADEMKVREAIFYSAKHEFEASNFSALERVSHEYLVNKSRAPSGVWKLTLVYNGIDSAFDDASDKGFAALDKVLEQTKRWQTLYPKSSSARIATSMALIKYGWAIRGSGYASTVRPEAWVPFEKKIAEARTNLEAHKSTDSADPQWYRTMLLIATAEGWGKERFNKLLGEAIEREPAFYENYFAALMYFLPKWHGDLNALEEFARTSVKATSKTEGSGMYARIYWYAAETEFSGNVFKESLADWKKMDAGFSDITAKFPDAWNFNNYAKFACLAGDKAKAKELTSRIRDDVAPRAWGSPAEYTKCFEWSHQR